MEQPKVLRWLAFAQLSKFFSHYGIRALLVLFMIKELGFADSRAFGVYAIFCGLVELGGIFGGVLADRYLGIRRSVILGGWILGAGYLALVFGKSLFPALALIILGGSLFAGNLLALLGKAYEKNDMRRQKGFTIFYMMQNLGALISTLACGIIAEKFGYQAGFAFCAVGMLAGNVALLCRRDLLAQIEDKPKESRPSMLFPFALVCIGTALLFMAYERYALPFLPWATALFFLIFLVRLFKDPLLEGAKLRLLCVYIGALILFYAAEDQITSSLLVFTERESSRMLFGLSIPSPLILTMNPVIILLFGLIVSKRKLPLLAPLAMVAFGFAGLALLCLLGIDPTVLGVLTFVVLISFAELMIGPLIYSFTSEVAAKGSQGTMMGLLSVGYSLAFFLAGGFSKLTAIESNASSLKAYGPGFLKIFGIVSLGTVLILALGRHFSFARETKSRVYSME